MAIDFEAMRKEREATRIESKERREQLAAGRRRTEEMLNSYGYTSEDTYAVNIEGGTTTQQDFNQAITNSPDLQPLRDSIDISLNASLGENSGLQPEVIDRRNEQYDYLLNNISSGYASADVSNYDNVLASLNNNALDIMKANGLENTTQYNTLQYDITQSQLERMRIKSQKEYDDKSFGDKALELGAGLLDTVTNAPKFTASMIMGVNYVGDGANRFEEDDYWFNPLSWKDYGGGRMEATQDYFVDRGAIYDVAGLGISALTLGTGSGLAMGVTQSAKMAARAAKVMKTAGKISDDILPILDDIALGKLTITNARKSLKGDTLKDFNIAIKDTMKSDGLKKLPYDTKAGILLNPKELLKNSVGISESKFATSLNIALPTIATFSGNTGVGEYVHKALTLPTTVFKAFQGDDSSYRSEFYKSINEREFKNTGLEFDQLNPAQLKRREEYLSHMFDSASLIDILQASSQDEYTAGQKLAYTSLEALANIGAFAAMGYAGAYSKKGVDVLFSGKTEAGLKAESVKIDNLRIRIATETDPVALDKLTSEYDNAIQNATYLKNESFLTNRFSVERLDTVLDNFIADIKTMDINENTKGMVADMESYATQLTQKMKDKSLTEAESIGAAKELAILSKKVYENKEASASFQNRVVEQYGKEIDYLAQVVEKRLTNTNVLARLRNSYTKNFSSTGSDLVREQMKGYSLAKVIFEQDIDFLRSFQKGSVSTSGDKITSIFESKILENKSTEAKLKVEGAQHIYSQTKIIEGEKLDIFKEAENVFLRNLVKSGVDVDVAKRIITTKSKSIDDFVVNASIITREFSPEIASLINKGFADNLGISLTEKQKLSEKAAGEVFDKILSNNEMQKDIDTFKTHLGNLTEESINKYNDLHTQILLDKKELKKITSDKKMTDAIDDGVVLQDDNIFNGTVIEESKPSYNKPAIRKIVGFNESLAKSLNTFTDGLSKFKQSIEHVSKTKALMNESSLSPDLEKEAIIKKIEQQKLEQSENPDLDIALKTLNEKRDSNKVGKGSIIPALKEVKSTAFYKDDVISNIERALQTKRRDAILHKEAEVILEKSVEARDSYNKYKNKLEVNNDILKALDYFLDIKEQKSKNGKISVAQLKDLNENVAPKLREAIVKRLKKFGYEEGLEGMIKSKKKLERYNSVNMNKKQWEAQQLEVLHADLLEQADSVSITKEFISDLSKDKNLLMSDKVKVVEDSMALFYNVSHKEIRSIFSKDQIQKELIKHKNSTTKDLQSLHVTMEDGNISVSIDKDSALRNSDGNRINPDGTISQLEKRAGQVFENGTAKISSVYFQNTNSTNGSILRSAREGQDAPEFDIDKASLRETTMYTALIGQSGKNVIGDVYNAKAYESIFINIGQTRKAVSNKAPVSNTRSDEQLLEYLTQNAVDDAAKLNLTKDADFYMNTILPEVERKLWEKGLGYVMHTNEKGTSLMLAKLPENISFNQSKKYLDDKFNEMFSSDMNKVEYAQAINKRAKNLDSDNPTVERNDFVNFINTEKYTSKETAGLLIDTLDIPGKKGRKKGNINATILEKQRAGKMAFYITKPKKGSDKALGDGAMYFNETTSKFLSQYVGQKDSSFLKISAATSNLDLVGKGQGFSHNLKEIRELYADHYDFSNLDKMGVETNFLDGMLDPTVVKELGLKPDKNGMVYLDVDEINIKSVNKGTGGAKANQGFLNTSVRKKYDDIDMSKEYDSFMSSINKKKSEFETKLFETTQKAMKDPKNWKDYFNNAGIAIPESSLYGKGSYNAMLGGFFHNATQKQIINTVTKIYQDQVLKLEGGGSNVMMRPPVQHNKIVEYLEKERPDVKPEEYIVLSDSLRSKSVKIDGIDRMVVARNPSTKVVSATAPKVIWESDLEKAGIKTDLREGIILNPTEVFKFKEGDFDGDKLSLFYNDSIFGSIEGAKYFSSFFDKYFKDKSGNIIPEKINSMTTPKEMDVSSKIENGINSFVEKRIESEEIIGTAAKIDKNVSQIATSIKSIYSNYSKTGGSVDGPELAERIRKAQNLIPETEKRSYDEDMILNSKFPDILDLFEPNVKIDNLAHKESIKDFRGYTVPKSSPEERSQYIDATFTSPEVKEAANKYFDLYDNKYAITTVKNNKYTEVDTLRSKSKILTALVDKFKEVSKIYYENDAKGIKSEFAYDPKKFDTFLERFIKSEEVQIAKGATDEYPYTFEQFKEEFNFTADTTYSTLLKKGNKDSVLNILNNKIEATENNASAISREEYTKNKQEANDGIKESMEKFATSLSGDNLIAARKEFSQFIIANPWGSSFDATGRKDSNSARYDILTDNIDPDVVVEYNYNYNTNYSNEVFKKEYHGLEKADVINESRETGQTPQSIINKHLDNFSTISKEALLASDAFAKIPYGSELLTKDKYGPNDINDLMSQVSMIQQYIKDPTDASILDKTINNKVLFSDSIRNWLNKVSTEKVTEVRDSSLVVSQSEKHQNKKDANIKKEERLKNNISNNNLKKQSEISKVNEYEQLTSVVRLLEQTANKMPSERAEFLKDKMQKLLLENNGEAIQDFLEVVKKEQSQYVGEETKELYGIFQSKLIARKDNSIDNIKRDMQGVYQISSIITGVMKGITEMVQGKVALQSSRFGGKVNETSVEALARHNGYNLKESEIDIPKMNVKDPHSIGDIQLDKKSSEKVAYNLSKNQKLVDSVAGEVPALIKLTENGVSNVKNFFANSLGSMYKKVNDTLLKKAPSLSLAEAHKAHAQRLFEKNLMNMGDPVVFKKSSLLSDSEKNRKKLLLNKATRDSQAQADKDVYDYSRNPEFVDTANMLIPYAQFLYSSARVMKDNKKVLIPLAVGAYTFNEEYGEEDFYYDPSVNEYISKGRKLLSLGHFEFFENSDFQIDLSRALGADITAFSNISPDPIGRALSKDFIDFSYTNYENGKIGGLELAASYLVGSYPINIVKGALSEPGFIDPETNKITNSQWNQMGLYALTGLPIKDRGDKNLVDMYINGEFEEMDALSDDVKEDIAFKMSAKRIRDGKEPLTGAYISAKAAQDNEFNLTSFELKGTAEDSFALLLRMELLAGEYQIDEDNIFNAGSNRKYFIDMLEGHEAWGGEYDPSEFKKYRDNVAGFVNSDNYEDFKRIEPDKAAKYEKYVEHEEFYDYFTGYKKMEIVDDYIGNIVVSSAAAKYEIDKPYSSIEEKAAMIADGSATILEDQYSSGYEWYTSSHGAVNEEYAMQTRELQSLITARSIKWGQVIRADNDKVKASLKKEILDIDKRAIESHTRLVSNHAEIASLLNDSMGKEDGTSLEDRMDKISSELKNGFATYVKNEYTYYKNSDNTYHNSNPATVQQAFNYQPLSTMGTTNSLASEMLQGLQR